MSIHQMLFAALSPSAWTGNVITATGNNDTTSAGLVNIWYRRSILMWTYSAAELQAAFGKAAATITALRFSVTQQPANQPLPAYAVGMKNGNFGASSPGNTGYTVVKAAGNESFTTGSVKSFDPLTTPFAWTGGDLAIIVAWGQCPTGYSASGQTPTGSGTLWYSWVDDAGTYVINTDNPVSSVSYRPVVQLYG